MLCSKCYQPLVSKHLIGKCKCNSKLRIFRHHITSKLLRDLLQINNGRRWPIISIDLRKKSHQGLQNINASVNPLTTRGPISTIPRGHLERLQNDKTTIKHSTLIPSRLLTKHKRPHHHKPDIRRAIRYKRNARGHLANGNTYKVR